MLTPTRLGVACLGIVAILVSSGCSNSDPQPDATVTPSVSKSAVPPPPSTTTSTASPSPSASTTPTPAATHDPDDSPATSSPPAEPTIPGASAQVTLATIDSSTGDLIVGGFVTSIIEDNGDCSFTAKPASGGPSLVARTTGVANVDNTSCGSTTIPASQLSSGTYEVILTYRDSKGVVASAPLLVNVS